MRDRCEHRVILGSCPVTFVGSKPGAPTSGLNIWYHDVASGSGELTIDIKFLLVDPAEFGGIHQQSMRDKDRTECLIPIFSR